MKVVLFCGGRGMRMRGLSENVPKPLVRIGYRPIVWHLMRWYAYHGHREFILCLGYKADTIKEYFLGYDECLSNDFVLEAGGRVNLLSRDTQDWSITFVDTGLAANVGERFWRVREHLEGDELFLANYCDALCDLPLGAMISDFRRSSQTGMLVSVRPSQSFHVVEADAAGRLRGLAPATRSGLRINGGFFVFRQDVFDYFEEGDDLVEGPLQRLISAGRLGTYAHDGFWACMDTYKERQVLEDLHGQGEAPWEVWKRDRGGPLQVGERAVG